MAVKSRFKKKETEVHSMEDKEKRLEEAKLTLVKSPGEFDGELHLGDLSSLQVENILERKINCYHKINELYQDNSLGLFHLMRGLLEIIGHGVDAEGGSLWILDEETDELTCKVASGPGSEKLSDFKVKNGVGIVGWVSKNGKSTIVYDTKKDQRFIGKNDFNTKTLVACPLLYRDEVIGVIEVVNKKNNSEAKYSDDDKSFLEDLGTLAAMHIKTSRSLKKQEEVVRRLENFSELHERFSSTLDLDPLLELVLRKAITLLRAEVGSLWLVEESGEGIFCAYAEGPTKDKVIGLKLRMGTGIIGSVIADKKSQIVEDCTKDERFSSAVDEKTNFKTQSIISVPLVVQGECIGAIQIINKKGKDSYFNNEDLELLSLFGLSSGMYIKNARLFASEKKAKDLSALIEITKEITSSLDLDSILTSLVNLSSNIIPFDEAHVAVADMKDNLEIRAISGHYEVDHENEKYQRLEKIYRQLTKGEDSLFYVSSKEECPENISGLKEYMEEYDVESFWVTILKDDQGIVGLYSLESEDQNFVTENRGELLAILAGQATVALRNADLYNTIPNAQVFKNYKDKIIKTIVNFRNQDRVFYKKLAGICAGIMLLMFLPIPHNVGTKIEILPKNYIFNSEVNGVVENVMVKEGESVNIGDLILTINVEESLSELKNKEFMKLKAKIEMFKLREEGKIADYKIKEAEYLSLEQEVILLEKKIAKSKIYSPINGVVLSESLNDLVGMPVNFGQELVRLSNQDEMIIQFNVPEEEVNHVRQSQDVVFKVYGQPLKSYSGHKIRSIAGEGRQVLDSDPSIYYLAKASVAKTAGNNILKPGMTGRGKIKAGWIYLGSRVFSKLYHFIIMEFLF
jgi:GAF domain-containing protein